MNPAQRDPNDVLALTGVPSTANDKLQDMMNAQKTFMAKLGTIALDHRIGKLSVTPFVRDLTKVTETCTTAINCEVTELLNELPWKPWKQSHTEVELGKVHLEIIDLLHFVLQLALIWGLSAEEVHALFMKKSQENLDRQTKGY